MKRTASRLSDGQSAPTASARHALPLGSSDVVMTPVEGEWVKAAPNAIQINTAARGTQQLTVVAVASRNRPAAD